MSEEVARLRALLGPSARREHAGPFELGFGEIEGVSVVLAESGVGKVNAAALTHELLRQGAERVIFTGVAGALALGLGPGDVVVGSSAVQHDVDVTALGYAPGEVPGTGQVFDSDPTLVRLAERAAREAVAAERRAGGERSPLVVIGRIASGDVFVASAERAAAIREGLDGACAEMEGAACAQVCARWSVPFVIVRSISDSADHSSQTDFRQFTALAAERAERIVARMLRSLADQGGATALEQAS